MNPNESPFPSKCLKFRNSLAKSKRDTLTLDNQHQDQLQEINGKSDNSNWLDSIWFVDFLGSGSFGLVLKAQSNSGANSVVKISFQEYSLEEDQLILQKYNNFIGQRQRHENIIETFGLVERCFSQDDIDLFQNLASYDEAHSNATKLSQRAAQLEGLDGICIHMELCGPSLRQFLENPKISEKADFLHVQVGIVQGLVAGLEFLHRNEIIHRNLKPENVHFSLKPDIDRECMLPIKIGNFGLPRPDCGEPNPLRVEEYLYTAPEAISGVFGVQSDLFSLGLMIWEVVQQIKKPERVELFYRLVYDNEISLVGINEKIKNFKEIILALTQKEVEKRAKNVREICLDLRESKSIITKEEKPLLQKPVNVNSDLQEGEKAGKKGPLIKTLLWTIPIILMAITALVLGIFGYKWLKNGDNNHPNLYKVNDVPELLSALKNSSISVIKLTNSLYELNTTLIINQNTILLGSSNTILKSNVHSTEFDREFALILSDHCELRDLNLVLGSEWTYGINLKSHSILSDISVEGGYSSVKIDGDNNHLSKIRIKNADRGIHLNGSGNLVDQIQLENISWKGICIFGNRNQIDQVKCTEVKYGISVKGDENFVKNLKYYKTKGSEFIGLLVEGGSFNKVDSLECEGTLRERNDWGIQLKADSKNVTISNSKCGSVDLKGTSHKLVGVDMGELIKVYGTDSEIVNCTVGQCISQFGENGCTSILFN